MLEVTEMIFTNASTYLLLPILFLTVLPAGCSQSRSPVDKSNQELIETAQKAGLNPDVADTEKVAPNSTPTKHKRTSADDAFEHTREKLRD